MRENGFIATSILYSFFLLFVTLFIGLITAYLHNRILLSNINEEAWDTLVGINNTKLSDLEIGDYIKFDTSSDSNVLNSDARWIVAYITTNGSSKTYYFMSDTSAQNEEVTFKTSYDTISKVHSISPTIYNELKAATDESGLDLYSKAFKISGFKVYMPTSSLLSKIRNLDIDYNKLEAIYDVSDSYLIKVDQDISGYNNGSMYEYRMYQFTLQDQQNSIIPNYCGGSFNGSTVVYNSNNTFGFINVVKDTVKNGKYVDYCSYASPVTYTHSVSDYVVTTNENKNDEVANFESSSYRYRLVAEITLSGSESNTYIAGGKGTYMDPYLFTNGAKQS
jgi:hypothetical protein